MQKSTALFLAIIQIFVAVGAIPAGLSMVFQPDGSGLGMSTEVLQGSPFRDFFLPGLFLLLFNGIANVAGAAYSFKRHKYTGKIGLALGLFLVLWISVQVYYTGLQLFLQPLFFIIGLIEMGLAYLFIVKSNPENDK